MVHISDPDVSISMSLDEYVEFVQDHVDVGDLDSIVENAWSLRALANNRQFVLDGYHEELKTYWSGTSINENSPQSIVLWKNRDFLVRSNIWVPISREAAHSEFERNYFAYDLAHDHNFNFVTVGYFGDGYETDLYEYDYDRVQGFEGECVDLEDCGRHQLQPGRLMVYRSGRDVHIQYPPRQVSISLNLMCRGDETRTAQQYIFDVKEKKITRGAGDIASTRLFLLDIFRHLHDVNTIDILHETLRSHVCVRTRAYALNVLRSIAPDGLDLFHASASAKVLELSNLPLVHGSGGRDYSGT